MNRTPRRLRIALTALAAVLALGGVLAPQSQAAAPAKPPAGGSSVHACADNPIWDDIAPCDA